MSALMQAAFLAACLGQTDPGTVVMVNGDLGVVTFELAEDTPYQIDYPTSLLSVSFDREQTSPALPLTTYTSGGRGDFNSDGILDGKDVQCFADLFTPPVGTNECDAEQTDIDGDGQTDFDDIPAFVEALLGSYPADGVILYVQGLSVSTSLGDAAVDLLTDPDMDMTFSLADIHPITVVGLDISPSTGGLGTPLSITMTPASPPLAFDGSTTASWVGRFLPASGTPTPDFNFLFTPTQFHESSNNAATIVLGDGFSPNLPDLASLEGPGVLEGTLSINIPGIQLRRPFSFAPATDAITWESIDYPDGPGGLDAPELGGAVATLNPWLLSFLEIEVPSEELMLLSTGFHHAVVLRVEENPSSAAEAPQAALVDLVSFDEQSVEHDRVENLILQKAIDDGDPMHIVYHNDLYQPVILVDLELDTALYPNVTLLEIVPGGTVVVAPAVQ